MVFSEPLGRHFYSGVLFEVAQLSGYSPFLRRAIMLEHGPLMFVAMLLFLTGIQFLSVGLIGEMLSRTYYESQKKPVYTLREIKRRKPESTAKAGPR